MTPVRLRYHVPRSQVWPGSGGRQRGNTHVHVLADLHSGRLHRRAGEALCAKRRGWYERQPDTAAEYADLCPRCVEVCTRHGVQLPSAPDSRRGSA